MKPLPFRRRAFAVIAVGFVFLALGLSGSHNHAYEAIGIVFLIAGILTLRRGGRV